MKVATYEATVENGQIKLSESVCLPEHTVVNVVAPGVEKMDRIYVGTPRLAQPERATDFTKEVAVEPDDAGLR